MKWIQLTRGRFATVDDSSYEFLSRYNWHLLKGKTDRVGYAVRTLHIKGKHHTIFMHHHLLPKIKGLLIDHINRDSLDNRLSNLRYVTIRENILNQANVESRKEGYCRKGHPYIYYFNGKGRCRESQIEASRKYAKKKMLRIA